MPLVSVDCINGDPPLGEMLLTTEPGIITGAVLPPLFWVFCAAAAELKIPELTNPAEIEFPLQFRDLLSISYPLYWRLLPLAVMTSEAFELNPEDFLDLDSYGSKLRSLMDWSNVLPEWINKNKKIIYISNSFTYKNKKNNKIK